MASPEFWQMTRGGTWWSLDSVLTLIKSTLQQVLTLVGDLTLIITHGSTSSQVMARGDHSHPLIMARGDQSPPPIMARGDQSSRSTLTAACSSRTGNSGAPG